MLRALITGSHGFSGSHLRSALHERGWTVIGHGATPRKPDPGERYVRADLRRADDVARAVEEADPDVVFHLAGHFGGEGPGPTRDAVDVNAIGTRHLFAALIERGRPVRIVLAGSSAQYGAVPDPARPIDEDAPLRPVGAYGWSKIAAEAIALAHDGQCGLEVVAARPFNHVGPGEATRSVCSRLARRLALAEIGRTDVIVVGNVTAVRDFCDVRDVARGYLALAERGRPGRVYNLCSGIGVRISDVLDQLMALGKRGVPVQSDPARAGAEPVPVQVGSHERATLETGWRPEIPLRQSLSELLDTWRARVAREVA